MKVLSLVALVAIVLIQGFPAISRQNPHAAGSNLSNTPTMPDAASARVRRRQAPDTAAEGADATGFDRAVLDQNSISVQASGLGRPWINLGDGHELISGYRGEAGLINQMQAGQARPLSLAAADLDGDGVPDLLSGFAAAGGGIIAVNRGNGDAIYPYSREALARRASGAFTDAPFLSPTRLFEAPTAPDFMETGDFDGDGFVDVAIASRGDNVLYFLPGDGSGGLDSAKSIELPGMVTAMASGDVNRRDGLTDLVVAVSASSGPELLVYENPEGAFRGEPEVIPIPARASSIAVGYLFNYTYADIAVAADQSMLVVHGRDRKLSMNAGDREDVAPAVISRLALPAMAKSIAVGKFNGDKACQAAALLNDGRIETAAMDDTRPGELHAVKVTTAAPGGVGPNPRLVSARMTGRPGDDLILMDQAASRLRVIVGGSGQASGDSGNVVAAEIEPRGIDPVDLAVDDTPVAAIPMRLNASARNDLVVLRSGHVNASIAPAQFDNVFTVTTTSDAVAQCDFKLSATSEMFSSQGGTGSFMVTTADGCQYSPSDSDSWVHITSGSGSGPGTVTFKVDANVGPNGTKSRRSTIVVASGVDFSITQSGVAPSDLSAAGNEPAAGSPQATTAPPGSFRAALESAMTAPQGSSNEIVFNIGASGVPLITLSSALPALPTGSSLTIDGTTQAQFGGAPLVEISGAGTNVIVVPGSSNVVRGLVINNAGSPIQLGQGGHNTVEGNLIGTTAEGVSAAPNSEAGILISGGSDNMIGGTAAAASNVIAASLLDGITITNKATGNTVIGNFVGTDASRQLELPNKGNGIQIEQGATATTLGSPGSPNYFNANGLNGVTVSSGTNHLIINNAMQANQGNGLSITASTSSTIGGAQASNLGNGMWQNSQNGVLVGAGATGIKVQGNGIGVAFTGSTPVPFPNTFDGVVVHAKSNLIGGATPSLGNAIAFNGRDGVAVTSGLRNGILSNVIAANAPHLAIHLSPGTNNNAVPPVISAATVTSSAPASFAADSYQSGSVVPASSPVMVISFAFKAAPNHKFNMQFYVPQICNCTNCFTNVGIYSTQVTTDASGNAPSPVSITLTATPAANSFVNATATDAVNNTSQFSECVAVGSSSACEYTLSAGSQQFGSAGGTGSVGVMTSATCGYAPSDPDSWVHITSGASAGNGTVAFRLDPNTGTSSRQSVISIAAGVSFTVIEDGVGPDFSINLTPSVISGPPGTVTPVTVSITRTDGFTGNVTITPPAKANGVKPKPSTPVNLSGSTTSFSLNMKITSTAVAGTYQMTFTGTGSGLTGTRTATLNVTVQ